MSDAIDRRSSLSRTTSTLLPSEQSAIVQAIRTESYGWFWLAIFIAAALLYLLTSQRGASWQDSGRFQWRVLQGMLTDTNLVISHPLYILLGQLAKLGPASGFTARLTALSGVGAAISVANLAVLGSLVSGRKWIGLAAAAGFAVSHAVWWLATISEVYTLSVAGLTTELILLVLLVCKPRRWILYLLALVSGLGLSMHNFSLLPLPVYVAVVLILIYLDQLPLWSLLPSALAFTAGAGIYLKLIADQAAESGTLLGAIHDALIGGFGPAVLNTGLTNIINTNLLLVALSFISLTWLLALAGIFNYVKYLGSLLGIAFIVITILELVFALRYRVPDQFTFLLPSLVMLTIAAAVGASALMDKSSFWRGMVLFALIFSIMAPLVVYTIGPTIIYQSGLAPQRRRALPFREEVRYWIVPWKHNETSAAKFATAALQQAAPNGVILSDIGASYSLLVTQTGDPRYAGIQVSNLLADDLLLYDDDPDLFWQAVGNRPLYVISAISGYTSSALLEATEITEEGTLYRLSRKR